MSEVKIEVTEQMLMDCFSSDDAWQLMEVAVLAVIADHASVNIHCNSVTLFAGKNDRGTVVDLPPAAREWLDLSCTIDADEVDPISFVLEIPALFLSTPVRMAA